MADDGKQGKRSASTHETLNLKAPRVIERFDRLWTGTLAT
jgi:hypothetical protein